MVTNLVSSPSAVLFFCEGSATNLVSSQSSVTISLYSNQIINYNLIWDSLVPLPFSIADLVSAVAQHDHSRQNYRKIGVTLCRAFGGGRNSRPNLGGLLYS